jgi:hypothetical protein
VISYSLVLKYTDGTLKGQKDLSGNYVTSNCVPMDIIFRFIFA